MPGAYRRERDLLITEHIPERQESQRHPSRNKRGSQCHFPPLAGTHDPLWELALPTLLQPSLTLPAHQRIYPPQSCLPQSQHYGVVSTKLVDTEFSSLRLLQGLHPPSSNPSFSDPRSHLANRPACILLKFPPPIPGIKHCPQQTEIHHRQVD